MQINGVPGGALFDPSRFGLGRLNPSSVNNGNPRDALNVSQPSVDKAHALSSANGQQGSMIFGNVSLDLYFSRSESLSRDYSQQGQGGGSRTLHQELGRSFESSLSLDFSFLAQFDGAADKLKNLDSAVFEKFTKVANNLLDMKQGDFEQFVSATNEVFNAIEKALGMGSEGLDFAADFFVDQVGSFLDGVQNNIDYFNNNPLGQGADLGLGIPALVDQIKQSISGDLKTYLDQLIAKLNKGQVDGADTRAAMLDSIKKLSEDVAKRLEENRAQKQNVADIQNNPKPPQNLYSLEYSLYTEKSVSVSISSYYQQIDNASPDKPAGIAPVNVSA